MKKLLLTATVLAMFSALNAQTGEMKTTKKETMKKETQKEHVCTAACIDGKHMYAHGEKGHVCTEARKKKM